jgi:hypothetical protein
MQTILSPMSRRAHILIAACLGVPLMLAFAFLPVAWSHHFEHATKQTTNRAWLSTPPAAWPATGDEGHRFNARFGWTTISANHGLDAIASSRRTNPNVTWYAMIERRSGLPFRCLRRTQMSTQVMRTITPVPLSTWVQGLPAPAWFHDGRTSKDRLPIRPLPLGLAANYVFWSAIVWGIVIALSSLCARKRRLRGACPTCGYALAGLPACPECGVR